MATTSCDDLARTFAGLARELQSADGVAGTLQRIVDLSVDLVDACEHAGLSMVHGRRIETVTASSDLPRRVDAIQYETDQGPCLDAIREQEMFRSDDLSADLRWPEFSARAARETGIRSMLAFRLFVQADTMGALNLYASPPAAFPAGAEPLGAVLSAHAAVAIDSAREHEHVQQLERAQSSNRQIGQAVGILMATRGVTADEAFELLRDASSRLNVKLRDVAATLVDGHDRRARRVPRQAR
jgi:transcriptional regulator with GAF, ATPase, and Fis domain